MAGNVSDKMTRDAAASFRKQALQILKEGIDSESNLHPLDVSQAFHHERPTMGGSVPIELYRAVRLLAFREAFGSAIAAAVLGVSGRSVGRKLSVGSVLELADLLDKFAIGKTIIEFQSDDRMVFTCHECATCSGLPAIGEPFCHFEAGVIGGALETVFDKPVAVNEIKCWGLGDKFCSWEATLLADDSGNEPDSLELVLALAGKAASAMSGAYAIKQSNRQLRDAYRQLKESQRQAKDLTDMMVHDLRVPLTAVIGSMQTLSEMLDMTQDKHQSELLQMALSSGDTMLQMINSLLDVSRLEDGTIALHREPAAARELVDEAIAHLAITARRRRIKIRRDIRNDLPVLFVDSHRIVRVLMNLLANGLEHTSGGGEVTITVECDQTGMLRTSISDTGEGIPKEYIKKVFDKFVQVESYKSRKKISSGLGLTFCKLVVEAHGGKIWAESEPGVGSTFTFTLPLR